MSNRVCENRIFYCEHLELNRQTLRDVDNFKPAHKNGIGLVNYLQGQAFHDNSYNVQKIYIVRDKETDELVAYFGLRTGLISTNEQDILVNGEKVALFDVISGIELAEFAVNGVYLENHKERKGCGEIIFINFVLPIARKVTEYVGAEIIYGFSVDTNGRLLEKYLTDYSFKRLDPASEKKLEKRLRSRFDKGCTFIYQRL